MRLFLSYSHTDEIICKRLESVLRLQEHQGVKLWRDDQIIRASIGVPKLGASSKRQTLSFYF